MTNFIKFERLESKLIRYKDEFVLVGSMLLSFMELKQEVVKNFDHLSKLKFSPHLSKIFDDKSQQLNTGRY